MSTFTVEDLHFLQWGPIGFSLVAGQCMSIRGASGSGKSLLLRCLADLDPHQGRIYLNGAEHLSLTAPQWRCKVGLMPATPVWWYDTVGEHLERKHLPHLEALGFSSDVLSWNIERLSSGEQQRLALVRLLAHEPEVLLLDEPSANLDQSNTQQMETLVLSYLKQRQAVAVWVSHDAEQASRVAQQCFVFQQRHLLPQTL